MLKPTSKAGRSEPLRVSVAVAIALAATLAVSQLTMPYIPIDQVLGDLWVETDAIWRASLGQAPGRDFITPLGPLFYGVYGLLTLIEPPSHAPSLQGRGAR